MTTTYDEWRDVVVDFITSNNIEDGKYPVMVVDDVYTVESLEGFPELPTKLTKDALTSIIVDDGQTTLEYMKTKPLIPFKAQKQSCSGKGAALVKNISDSAIF